LKKILKGVTSKVEEGKRGKGRKGSSRVGPWEL